MSIPSKFLPRSVVIVFGNPKGGVGKTTIAVNLAAVLAKDYGAKVVLVDGEKNGTLSTFAFDAGMENRPEIRVGYGTNLAADLAMLKAFYDVVIVDTAGITPGFSDDDNEAIGGQERVSLVALSQADLLLVPVTPSPADIRKTVAFLPTVEKWMIMRNGKLKGAMILNEVKPNQKLTGMVREAIDGQFDFLPVMRQDIRESTVVKQSFGVGLGVVDYLPRHAVSHEYRQLGQEITALLHSHLLAD